FTGRPMEARRYAGVDPVAVAIREAPNGAGVLIGTVDDYNTRELIEQGVPDPPVEVFTIERIALRPAGADHLRGGALSFRVDGTSLVAEGDYGELRLASAPSTPRVDVRAGQRIEVPGLDPG